MLDGHNSHVTLDMVHQTMQIGLDLLTLPSHNAHALQALDGVWMLVSSNRLKLHVGDLKTFKH